ncbi:DUF3085 domain-containing protein [Pararhizobium sp. YC-54]|uniref:DUF3085 domain-containing protein n=1 Tax=Pararhizobium sp. YC-54 TaxID=2986920 RepID=UPI0021F6DD1F|nr:DUF3085 domain-containing protein [Pararhizobium sp. YC-54]MCV9999236.1 DUF3085 domain-containing protein [Pararhizobium sp. YC-54]
MLSFPIEAVREIIARGRKDAAAHGGYRNPYYGMRPGEGEQPGLWLVGDHGVYVMSNGRLPEGSRPLVAYAEECDPTSNDDWFHIKRQTFGGADGVAFSDADHLEAMMTASRGATHLSIAFQEETMELSVLTRA